MQQLFKITYDSKQSETATRHDIEQWPEMASKFNQARLDMVAQGKLRRFSTSCHGIPCDVEVGS